MKAWTITTDYGNYSLVVFDATRNGARAQARGTDEFHDREYTEIRAHRSPEFDGRETDPPTFRELVENHEWHGFCHRCETAVYGDDAESKWIDDSTLYCGDCVPHIKEHQAWISQAIPGEAMP